MNREQQRAELHRTIWNAANQLVHGGVLTPVQFMNYMLGGLFYRFISENITDYLNKKTWKARGDNNFNYSDISDAMNLPRPGVTRTVKEMEAKGYLHKFASKEDGRVTYISITEEGKELSQKYDQDYFSELACSLGDISEEDADCMIRTIEKFYQIMCERRKEYDK